VTLIVALKYRDGTVLATDSRVMIGELKRDPKSIRNMATFEYALEHFEALTIPVPILLIGLLPEN